MCFGSSSSDTTTSVRPSTPMPHRQQIRNALRRTARPLRGSNVAVFLSTLTDSVLAELGLETFDLNRSAIRERVKVGIKTSHALFTFKGDLVSVRKNAKL